MRVFSAIRNLTFRAQADFQAGDAFGINGNFKQENKAQCSLVGLFNLLSFIGAIDIIGISKNRQYIKVLEIIGVFGSALPLLSQHEVRCAAEGDVKGEDEAEDEREGAEEDGAVVGVQVGMQGRG